MGDVTVDINANSRRQSSGEPQLDKALQQWLSWDKVSRRRRRGGGVRGFGPRQQLQMYGCSKLKHRLFPKTTVLRF